MSSGHEPENSSDISYRQLRAFLAVVDYCTVSIAAKQLHISQSGLSRAIVKLERNLGVSLFRRGVAGLQLTEAGEAFLSPARRLAACFVEVAAPEATDEGDPLVLVASNVIQRHVLHPLLERATPGGDGRGLTARELPSHLVLDHLRAGHADLGLCMLSAFPGDMACVPVLKAPLGLLIGAGMELPGRIEDLRQLRNLPFVKLSEEMVLPRALRESAVEFDAYFESRIVSNSMPALFSAVAKGHLATLVSGLAASNTSWKARFVPLPKLLPPLYLCILGNPTYNWQQRHAHWIEAIRASIHNTQWLDCVDRL